MKKRMGFAPTNLVYPFLDQSSLNASNGFYFMKIPTTCVYISEEIFAPNDEKYLEFDYFNTEKS